MSSTRSTTERDTNAVERILDTHHYKDTITDGRDRVERHGRTAEEAQERASQSWRDKKGS